MKRIRMNGMTLVVSVYGSDRTGLRLSEKAQKFYNGTDPLYIYEHDGLYTYDMGDGCGDWLDAEKLNAELEMLQDENDRLNAEE